MSYKADRETSGFAALYRHRQSLQQIYAVSNCSPVTTVIGRPNWVIKFITASHHGPSVSTATGTKW